MITMAEKIKVGVIGCGNISSQYIRNMKTFDILEVKSVTDIDPDRANAVAAEHGLQAVTTGELLADPEIRIIANFTVPAAHTEISLRAIAAGKSIYNEKPLALTRAEGRCILAAAEEKNVLVGCAPDTILGGGLQTCRKLVDDGWIGQPVAAAAFLSTHGPELWHPNPEFYYQAGAGPLFDLGPYLLAGLVFLFGPARRVTSSARISFPERPVLSQPLYGKLIRVEAPTHVAGVIDFHSGVVANLTTSFDIWDSTLPRLEIYGSEGSLSMPAGNKFTGPVRVRRAGAETWSEAPLTHNGNVGRGIGIADMAYALTSGREHRANGELAYHLLDVMHALLEASQRGQHLNIESHCERPSPLPLGLRPQELDP
jgi:predicted dehydrogenase